MFAKKRLFSAMAGLVMMALPVSAIAADHHHNWNQTFAGRPAAVQNQFFRSHGLSNQIARNQARPGFGWGGGSAFGTHPNYAWNHQSRQNWGNHHNDGGNWMTNAWPGWNAPRSAQPAYRYAPSYAYNQPYAPMPPSNFSGSSYGYGNRYGYSSPNQNAYGFGGGLMALRDRLLQERAGAYQQLAIRERNGDSNGAHICGILFTR